MNSTGQNLGTNPLLAAETATSVEVAVPTKTVDVEDKSMNKKTFSDVLGRQKETQQSAVTQSTAAVEDGDSTSGKILSPGLSQWSEGTRKTLFAADSGKALPAAPASRQVLPAVADDALPITTDFIAAPEGVGVVDPLASTSAPVTKEDTTTLASASAENMTGAPVIEQQEEVLPPGSAVDSPSAEVVSPAVAIVDPNQGKTTRVVPDGGNDKQFQRSSSQVNVRPQPAATGLAVNTNGADTKVTAEATEVAKSAGAFTLSDASLSLRIKPQPDKLAPLASVGERAAVAGAAEPEQSTVLPSRSEVAQLYKAASTSGAPAEPPVALNKPGWGETVMQRVMWMSSQQINKAEIALDPPELGSLHVKISTQGEQTSVTFTSNQGGVRDTVDQNLPRLREMLENQGLDLADVNVADHSHDQEQQEGDESDFSGEQGSGVVAEHAAEGIEQPIRVQQLGLVDHYV